MPDFQLDGLRARAHVLGITLPPLAITPKRWMKALQSLRGPAMALPTEAKRILPALGWNQRVVLACAILGCIVGALASAMVPWALGNAVDTAMTAGVSPAFGLAVLVFVAMVALVALGDGLGELFDNGLWLGTEYTARRTLTFTLAERSRAMKRAATSGDVLTASMDDAESFGQFYESFANAVASVLVIILVAYLMLTVSVPLGLTVLIGMPITLGVIALVGGPLERRQAAVRDAQGHLTTITTDAVQGLRILRGVGGEAAYAKAYTEQSEVVRQAGIRAAKASSILDAVSMGGPLFLVSLVVAQGALLALDGAITPGQLVAFYGYTFYLRMPLWIATRLVENFTRAKVGAKRVAELLTIDPLIPSSGDSDSDIDWAIAEVGVRLDSESVSATGLVLTPGRITGLVAPTPEAGARIARALGCTDSRAGLVVNGQSAEGLALDLIRTKVVLSEASPQVFAGTLRDALLGAHAPVPVAPDAAASVYTHVIDSVAERRDLTPEASTHPADERLLAALGHAHAQDVLDSIPGGLDGTLDEKGRNLSGGQRQRLVLARAYATQAPVLVLVEPTSALDAHTEALIGGSLQAARGGQTTLVVTHSPLLLTHCDEVVITDAHGAVVARDSYANLRSSPHGGALDAILGRGGEG